MLEQRLAHAAIRDRLCSDTPREPRNSQPADPSVLFARPVLIGPPLPSSAVDQATNEMVAIKKMTNVFSHVAETKRTLREVHPHRRQHCRRPF